jgi:hypothetical protein
MYALYHLSLLPLHAQEPRTQINSCTGRTSCGLVVQQYTAPRKAALPTQLRNQSVLKMLITGYDLRMQAS